MNDARTTELRENLLQVDARIGRACIVAGRDRADVTLVVITKTWPAVDVRRLASLGVVDVGENRDQDAAPKADACADLDLRWHFVGQLQTNKCRSVARYADVVHSVDRSALVTVLGSAALGEGRTLGALIQVGLGEEGDPAGRGGAAPPDVLALADLVARTDGLRLEGVMALGPRGTDPRAAFARLFAVAQSVRTEHPAARVVSAGMTGDLEAAIQAGATHVRVGTAVLGTRPSLG